MQFFRSGAMLLLVLALLTVGYTNCNKVAVSDVKSEKASANEITGENDAGAGPDIRGPLPPAPVDPGQLSAACDNARALGKMRSTKVSANFANPGRQCSWQQDGNLSILNGFVRARIEQLQNFQVTTADKATVCHIKMQSQREDRFIYDDNIIVTLNGYILASTTNFSRYFPSQNGYHRYDWNQLIGKGAQNAKEDTQSEDQYCAGSSLGISTCQFPQTETYGSAQLQIGERVIQAILAMTNPQSFTLGVITTGDNDSTDCQHTAIDLNLDIEYILE